MIPHIDIYTQSISHSNHFKRTQTITQAIMAAHTQFASFSEWMSEKHPEIPKKVQVTHADGTPEFIENKMYKNKRATYNRLKKEHEHNSQVDTVKAHNDRLQAELEALRQENAKLLESQTTSYANYDLNQENAKLQAANHKVNQANALLHGENTELKKKVTELEECLAAATQKTAGGGGARPNPRAKYTTREAFILAKFDLTEMPPSKIESRNRQGRVMVDGQGKICRRSNPEYTRIQSAWKKYREETGQLVTTTTQANVTRREPIEYEDSTTDEDEFESATESSEVECEEWKWNEVTYWVDEDGDVIDDEGDVIGKRVNIGGKFVLQKC